jgi:hypothetical protein
MLWGDPALYTDGGGGRRGGAGLVSTGTAAVSIARRRPPHRRPPPPAGHGDESEQVSRDPGEDAQLRQVGRVSRLLEMPLPSLLGN